MVAEQSDEETGSPEGRRLRKSKQFWRQMKVFMDNMFQQERRGGNVHMDKNKRVSLEEKHFRRMDKFGGETSKF
eukprot:8072908-Karenia_brevis.AAC.1